MLSVPLKLLAEGEGHMVTMELKSGDTYRGILVGAESNMNATLEKVTHTDKSGRVSKLEHVYVRGSHIRFVVLPDLLRNAPVLGKVAQAVKKNEDKKKA